MNVCDVREMRAIEIDTAAGEVRIGAAVPLDEILADQQLDRFTAVKQVIRNIGSSVGISLVMSGLVALGLIAWSYRRFRRASVAPLPSGPGHACDE